MSEQDELRRAEWAFREAIRRAKADAWNEGYEAGSDDARAFDAVTESWVEFDEYEDTPNPYQDTP